MFWSRGRTRTTQVALSQVRQRRSISTCAHGHDGTFETRVPTRARRRPGRYHDEGAVEVETLSAAFGHHVPAAAVAVLQHGADEEQQAEEGVGAQEEQLAAVVVPVDPRQVARRVVLLLLVQVRRLQPVGSAGEAGSGF